MCAHCKQARGLVDLTKPDAGTKALRDDIKQSICARFTTVLGPVLTLSTPTISTWTWPSVAVVIACANGTLSDQRPKLSTA